MKYASEAIDIIQNRRAQTDFDALCPELMSQGEGVWKEWTAAFIVAYDELRSQPSGAPWNFCANISYGLANIYLSDKSTPWGRDNRELIDLVLRKMGVA